MTKYEVYYRLMEAYVNINPVNHMFWISEDLYYIIFGSESAKLTVNWKFPGLNMMVGILRIENPEYEEGIIEWYTVDPRKRLSKRRGRMKL